MILVPSRGRREGLERFFSVSRPSVVGRVLVDDDDPSYDGMTLPENWAFFRRPRAKTTHIINRAFEAYPEQDFYAVVGDDMDCSPDGWDVELSRDAMPNFVSWGDDGRWGSKLCPSFFIGGDLVRRMGWIVHPSFGHLYGDTVWWMIASGARLGHYRPDIRMIHNNQKDKTYQQRQTAGDHEAFEKLRQSGMSDLIRKARELADEKMAKQNARHPVHHAG